MKSVLLSFRQPLITIKLSKQQPLYIFSARLSCSSFRGVYLLKLELLLFERPFQINHSSGLFRYLILYTGKISSLLCYDYNYSALCQNAVRWNQHVKCLFSPFSLILIFPLGPHFSFNGLFPNCLISLGPHSRYSACILATSVSFCACLKKR